MGTSRGINLGIKSFSSLKLITSSTVPIVEVPK